MLASWSVTAEAFESAMLVCFGCSWPMHILKTLRTKVVAGQSPAFLLLILLGYVAGLTAKLIRTAGGEVFPPPATYLYALNGLMVGFSLYLYVLYSRRRAGESQRPG